MESWLCAWCVSARERKDLLRVGVHEIFTETCVTRGCQCPCSHLHFPDDFDWMRMVVIWLMIEECVCNGCLGRLRVYGFFLGTCD